MSITSHVITDEEIEKIWAPYENLNLENLETACQAIDAEPWHHKLKADGWKHVYTNPEGQQTCWTKPPATTTDQPQHAYISDDCLYTLTYPELQRDQRHTKYTYYRATHHNGNGTQADTELATNGYNMTANPTPTLLEQLRINWDEFWNTDHSQENWLLEPLIAKGRNHSITAAAKQGKSLITLAALAPASLGHPVLGRPAGTALRIVYLDYEMSAADVQERLSDMGFDQGFTPEAFAYLLHPPLPSLDTQAGGIQVHELALQHHADLVVIDTYSRAIEGADDSTDTVKALYRHTITPLLAKGITVLRLDHTGHKSKERARGSSGKADDIDVGWMLTKTEGGIKLKSTHARMQWVPETVNLKLGTDPLRLELVQGGWPHGTKDAANKLSAAGVIPGDTTRTAGEKLRATGGKLSNELLRAGVRYLPEMISLIAGQTESAPE